MITVIGGIKGGGGKTTIATNLCVMRAATGNKVLLIDADEQRTASDWASQRIALGIETKWTTIQLAGRAINSEIKKLSPNYDNIIIDVGGRDTTTQRSALTVADRCIIPFKPKSFDMWTLGAVKTMIQEIRIINDSLEAYVILNQAESRGSDNEDAFSMVAEFSDFICLPAVIGHRKSFANAAADGLGVLELKKPDPKASSEIMVLYKYAFGTDFIQF